MPQFERIRIAPPTGPVANGTVELFNSVSYFGAKQMSAKGVGRVSIDFPGLDYASAASGLQGYTSGDGGVTWDPFSFSVNGATAVLPSTVAAKTATDYSSYDLFVGNWDDVKFTFTAGATPPTTTTGWRPVIVVRIGDVHVGF